VPGLSCKGSWLEGRSGVAGSGWVKWPQLDLQCQPEFFFFFWFAEIFYWGRNHLDGGVLIPLLLQYVMLMHWMQKQG